LDGQARLLHRKARPGAAKAMDTMTKQTVPVKSDRLLPPRQSDQLELPTMSRGDVAFAFSYLTWEASAKRGWFATEDRLAKALVSHPRARRILVCDRVRSLPVKLLRDSFSRGAPFPNSERARLLSPVRLRRRDPTSRRGVERTFRSYDRAMERATQRMGMKSPVVITTNPLLAGFAEFSWARAVTFYALDDWATHPAYRTWWPAYRDAYELINQREHRVAAVSQALLERLAPTGPAAVIANGLEPMEWLGPGEPANSLAPSSRPLLIYAGSLDGRLDTTWLLETAKALPHATIALVGPLIDPEHLQPLRGEPNIAIRPPLERQALASLVRSADAGLIPHVRSPLTEAMSPLKLYEYLAGGLPVAATDLAPMRGIDPRVLLVPEGGDFAAATSAALAKGKAPEPSRRAFLEANSWRRRHDCLLDLALA
jgi:teichuronic acid biosynthesis glycosyltransferase TuaH